MKKKLTLKLDEALIAKAKHHAASNGKSVSQMVADYFQLLERDTNNPATPLGPKTRALKGLLESSHTIVTRNGKDVY